MSTTYTVGVRVDGNAASFLRATRQAADATRSMGSAVRSEFARIQQAWSSTQGKLASLGLGLGVAQMQRQAAQLQKTMTQVALTAGMSVTEQAKAYEQMFAMVKRNGGVMEDTVAGFNSLVQAGLSYQEAMKSIGAISTANAVTGADASVLANALTVGSANFGFDLAKGNTAIEMLDKMTASGRLGNAELENLSNILPTVAAGAQQAGMDFDKTLAFLQALSMVEKQPERLATLAESTTRLFTNLRYARDAEKHTGVRMFENGRRRNPVDVLDELRKKYSALTTDAQRFSFMGKAFGSADITTQKGLSALLSGELLQKIREFERVTKGSGGVLEGDLPRALDNAAKQSERLKNALRHAVETGFANPLNEAISKAIQFTLDDKEKGGMGLSGGQVIGGAAAGAAGVYAISRFLPPLVRGLVGRAGGLGAGVATGKALEAAAGVTPVYVTNWAEMNGGGAGGVGAAAAGAAGGTAMARMLAAGRMLGGVGLAAAGGWAVGSLISKAIEGTAVSNVIGRGIAKTLAFFGNQDAATAVRQEYEVQKAARSQPDQAASALERAIRRSEFKGEVMVRVLSAPGVGVDADVWFTNPSIPLRADVGVTNQGAGY